MTQSANAFAAAAERCLGVPFKLHGRNPRFGLDCIGLVIHSLSESTGTEHQTKPYRIRNTDYSHLLSGASCLGFGKIDSPVIRGDVLAVIPGAGQMHFAIVSGPRLLIHSHAGVGKVVKTPGPLPWPTLHKFRLLNKE